MWTRIGKFLVIIWCIQVTLVIVQQVLQGGFEDAAAVVELPRDSGATLRILPVAFDIAIVGSLVGMFWLFARKVTGGPVAQAILLATLLATLPDLVFATFSGQLASDWARTLPLTLSSALVATALARLSRGRARSLFSLWFDRSHPAVVNDKQGTQRDREIDQSVSSGAI